MGSARLTEINDGYIPAEFAVTLDSQQEFYRIWYLLHALGGTANVKALLNSTFPSLGDDGDNVQNVTSLANSLKSEMDTLAESRGYLNIIDDAPVIDEEHGTHVDLEVGDEYDNSLKATDPQQGDLTWSMPVGPGYLSVIVDEQGTPRLVGTPTVDDVGTHDVVLRVDSTSGLMSSVKTYFEVSDTEATEPSE